MNKALNITTVVLLGVVALGVFVMPRFNYGVLVQRQAKVERAFNTIQGRIEKIELFSKLDDEKRSASLKLIDSIPELLMNAQEQYSGISGQHSLILRELNSIESRLRCLENAISGQMQGSNDQSRKPFEASSKALGVSEGRLNYLSPIELPKDLAQKARAFAPSATAEDDFIKFLEKAIRSKVLADDDIGQIPQAGLERLHHLFELYRTRVQMVDVEQNLFIQTEVERRTREGDFFELPFEAQALRDAFLPQEVAIRHVVPFPDTGLQRVFNFPVPVYPRILEFNEMRDNARDHLVYDASQIAESFIPKRP